MRDATKADLFVLPIPLFWLHVLGEASSRPHAPFGHSLTLLNNALSSPSDSSVSDWFAFLDKEHASDQQRLLSLVNLHPEYSVAAAAVNTTLTLSKADLQSMFPEHPPILEQAPLSFEWPTLGSPSPSVYRSFFSRHLLRDHVLVANRPRVGWDKDRLWTKRELDSPIIYLSMEVTDVAGYRNDPKIGKDIAIPYPINPQPIIDNAGYLLCMQLQEEWRALIDSSFPDSCGSSSPEQLRLYDRYVYYRAAHSTSNSSSSHPLNRDRLAVFIGTPHSLTDGLSRRRRRRETAAGWMWSSSTLGENQGQRRYQRRVAV